MIRVVAAQRFHPTASRAAGSPGAWFSSKSGTSSPVHSPFSWSHQMSFLRSLHGRPAGPRRPVVEHPPFIGHVQPHSGCRVLPAVRFAPRRLIDLVGVDAAVDPAAAHRAASALRTCSCRPRSRRQVDAVDAAQHVLARRLVALHHVVPRQVQQRPVPLVSRHREVLPQDAAQVVEEPQLRAGVARWFDRLLPPLQHPLRLRGRARLLHVRHRPGTGTPPCGRLRRISPVDLRAVLPERRTLDLDNAHHHPVEVGHAEALQPPVRRADRRVLPRRK